MRLITKLLGFQLLFLFHLSIDAQDCDTTVYEVVEEMPEFPGGMERLYEYMAGFTIPKVEDSNIQSKFYFEFIIRCDGSITELKPLKNHDHPITIAALNYLKRMPKWTPGKHQGHKVNVKYVIPLTICYMD
ncbi:energy transducer TonB [Parvicella tangerina]|nr:energy transducer TonB [Parvicella tangerina]